MIELVSFQVFQHLLCMVYTDNVLFWVCFGHQAVVLSQYNKQHDVIKLNSKKDNSIFFPSRSTPFSWQGYVQLRLSQIILYYLLPIFPEYIWALLCCLTQWGFYSDIFVLIKMCILKFIWVTLPCLSTKLRHTLRDWQWSINFLILLTTTCTKILSSLESW